jgi:PST family polysaccharide transporter
MKASTAPSKAHSSTGSVRRNAASLLLGRVLAQGLTVVFTLILARRLGAGGLGVYASVSAIVFLANVVTTFGTDMVLIRDVAARGGASRWGAALAVQLGLSAAAIAATWLLAPIVGAALPAAVSPLRIYSLSLLPSALFSVCTSVLRGQRRMGSYAALGVAASAIQLGVIWVIAPDAPLDTVFVALLGVQFAVAALAWAVCAARAPSLRAWPRASAVDIREMLRSTGTIGVLGLLGVAYQQAPVLVLAVASGPSAAGWYAGASRVVEASKTGHVALFGALYPAMAEAHGPDGRGDADPALGWYWRISAGAATLLSLALLVASPIVVRVLYGPAFGPSAAGMAILALSLVPSALATYQSLDLIARRREGATLMAQLSSMATLLGLLAALVPVLGWTGGCWAVLSAEVVRAAGLFAVRRNVLMARLPPRQARVAAGELR